MSEGMSILGEKSALDTMMRRVSSSPPRSRKRVWFPILASALLLPFAIAWPLGGLEDGTKRPPTITRGQSVTGHRLQITPGRAAFTTLDPAPAYGDPKPGRFVVLDLVVRNVSTMPVDLTTVYLDLSAKIDRYTLDPVADLHDQQILRDDNDAGMLNPKMPEKVRISWRVPDQVPEPKRFALAILDEEFQPSWSLRGYNSGTSIWLKQDIMATYETPLEQA